MCRQAKVTKLESTVPGDKDIGWLQVQVNDSSVVDFANSLRLCKKLLDCEAIGESHLQDRARIGSSRLGNHPVDNCDLLP